MYIVLVTYVFLHRFLFVQDEAEKLPAADDGEKVEAMLEFWRRRTKF